ncbi:hypothetical protein ACFWPU_01150 [Streptomyces sp. NPDC058471]|uniref:hypothetical protein n=1 Tax=Streptomyces sp. NPDC058471 TaxID=3346516 RepID=UPI00364EF0DA
MTTPPPELPTPIATPTAEETAAINNAYSDEEIRSLAQQLLKSGELPFDPGTYIKGTITAIDLDGSPPTLSIKISGDTTTTVSDVRLLNNYTPQVGHTVVVGKQGPDIVVLGHIAELSAYSVNSGAGGWVRAVLESGSHGGNSNGDIYYRRILDHGSWKMQWRGGWAPNGDTLMIDALAAEFRPTSRRSVLAARDASGASNVVKIDFETNGTVFLVGPNTAPFGSSVSGDVWYAAPSGGTGEAGFHQHSEHDGFGTFFAGSHSHGVSTGHDHGFSGGYHTHSVNFPTWVSLNDISYFL